MSKLLRQYLIDTKSAENYYDVLLHRLNNDERHILKYLLRLFD